MVFIQHVIAIQLIKNLRLITSFVVCFPRQLHSLNLFSHSISFTAILIACSHQWLGQPSPVFTMNFSSTPCICYMSTPSHFPSLTHPSSIRLRLKLWSSSVYIILSKSPPLLNIFSLHEFSGCLECGLLYCWHRAVL